ncbi:LOW QUALITY PROTEIN: hypothetical protein OSB04_013383 [Centaurea solstitialis]|uniref:Uncharacterized protein n=1 Tax=Centaurea solstitialis TaxID=347529 RepID=A0AA38WQK8_9ASTR|nr:LOW QUALITY PROTEIN: hypothetical protein OSB04_013383 [Centaurea solstitialis]
MDVEDVLTHPEENVVAQFVIGINKDDIDEEDDESSTMEPPSRNEAIKAAITLNNFLLSYEKTTPEVLTMLRKIRGEIQREIDFNKKQKTIESYLKKNLHKSFIFYCINLFCCHYFHSLLKRYKKSSGASNNDVISKIEEYRDCVLRIEDEAELTYSILSNMLISITKLLQKSEKEQPKNLKKFLGKSRVYSGRVLEFHNNQALPFEETNNSWSLVLVTLTTIAISLPNIAEVHVTKLLNSMREEIEFVRHIEETPMQRMNARKIARRIWIEAEVYVKWLGIKLQYQARSGKLSRDILQWLQEEALKIEDREKINDDSHVIAAKSMCRISETILCHFDERGNWPRGMELFYWISTMIKDLLWACFTNLLRVITLKCHHDAIEKTGESVHSAARLLGESKSILNNFEKSQFEDLDHQKSMTYIDTARKTSNSGEFLAEKSVGNFPADFRRILI